jgi:3-hydroxybutyryl-CoA dehydrogenase
MERLQDVCTMSDHSLPGAWSARVGVVGAGVIGRGVTQAIAAGGFDVVLVDVSDTILSEALNEISIDLKARALMNNARGRSRAQILSRISLSSDLTILAARDVVIENVIEDIDTKRNVYRMLGQTTRSDAILAANTSTFPIGEIAGFTAHPERVIGLHFMNPAQTKEFVEVIPGTLTSQHTISTSLRFLAAIGRTGILVKDAPGFVTNRILMLTINEAIRTVEAGTASAADVDRIFVNCLGHPLGPIATADLIGLDTILLSLESLLARLHDARYAPAPLLRRLVADKRFGRKTGKGFFEYGSTR